MQVCPELPMVSTSNRPLLVSSRPSDHVLYSWYNADTNNEVMPNVKMDEAAAPTRILVILWSGLLLCGGCGVGFGVLLYLLRGIFISYESFNLPLFLSLFTTYSLPG